LWLVLGMQRWKWSSSYPPDKHPIKCDKISRKNRKPCHRFLKVSISWEKRGKKSACSLYTDSLIKIKSEVTLAS
jgi:hypothetical protein